MNYKRINIYLSAVLFSTMTLLLSASNVLAVEVPNFPTCSNPEGTLIAEYDDGIHGIVGDEFSYEGSDAVYQVTNETVLQCFCDTDGEGIQTNFWKISSLDQNQVDTLVKLGWRYIPTGASWGLEDAPYMAKNANYQCGPRNNDNEDDETTGEVLGLASTGGNDILLAFGSLGLTLIITGLLLKKRS